MNGTRIHPITKISATKAKIRYRNGGILSRRSNNYECPLGGDAAERLRSAGHIRGRQAFDMRARGRRIMVQGMTEIDPFLPLVGIGTRHSRIPLAGLKRPLEATPCNRRGVWDIGLASLRLPRWVSMYTAPWGFKNTVGSPLICGTLLMYERPNTALEPTVGRLDQKCVLVDGRITRVRQLHR